MNFDSNPTITRITVVLNKPSDGVEWLFIRKDLCCRHDIWEYVNPDMPKNLLPKLTEPSEPALSSYISGAVSLADLEKEGRDSCRGDYDGYEQKLLEFKNVVQALAEFNLEIRKTVSKKQLYLIQDCDTPFERLVKLKKHLAPDASTRRHEIINIYYALKIAPSAPSKLDEGLSSGTRITTMGKSMKLSETDGIRQQEDFLVACKALDQEYATTCPRDVYRVENAGTTETFPSLDDFVAEFIAFLRCNKPQTPVLSVAAASLESASSAKNKPTVTSKSGRNGKHIPECLCVSNHWYAYYFILNDQHPKRPEDFCPAPEILQRVEKAWRDLETNEKVLSAL